MLGSLLRCLVAVVARMPVATFSWLGAGLGWWAGSVLRVRRREVEDAMRAAGIDSPRHRARAMYRSLGRSALEFVALSTPQASRILSRVHVDDRSRRSLADALALGRGIVVAGTHTGNWDLAACAMASTVELLVVTKRLAIRPLDRFWQAARAKHGVLLCDKAGALTQARRVLARGGAVVLMIDQVPEGAKRALAVDFLGRSALTDRAPAVLAASAGAPLVLVAGWREPNDDQRLSVLGTWHPPTRGARTWVDSITREATHRLGVFVREHPSDWLWLHRRWKRLDSGARETMLFRPCATHSPLPGGRSRAV
ncbi:MAG: lysophospholipid acyltransferase family protein [Polyangiaceae bacterium]|jgi:KDO2-lipid IV(A) lauroyltransferase